MINIRPLADHEHKAFCQLFQDWDSNKVYDWDLVSRGLTLQKQFGSTVYVAFDEETMVAYMQLAPGLHLGHDPYLEIVQILVDKDHRSKGIGTILVKQAEAIARELGFSVLKLSSRIQRSRAHVFYEDQGFELEKVSKFYIKILTLEE